MYVQILKELIHTANDAQAITHALSHELNSMARAAGPELRSRLIVLAASAELATDKASLIIDTAKEVD